MTRPGTPTIAEQIEREARDRQQRESNPDRHRYNPVRVWALEQALRDIIVADQRDKFTTIECDAAGNTQRIDKVDGPCATLARAALEA